MKPFEVWPKPSDIESEFSNPYTKDDVVHNDDGEKYLMGLGFKDPFHKQLHVVPNDYNTSGIQHSGTNGSHNHNETYLAFTNALKQHIETNYIS